MADTTQCTTCTSGYGDYARYAEAVERDGQLLSAILKRWHSRWQTRRTLSRLSDASLKDIGLSRAAAEREANKPFWIQ